MFYVDEIAFDRKSRREATCTEANADGIIMRPEIFSRYNTSTDIPLFTAIALIHPRSDELYQWRFQKFMDASESYGNLHINHNHESRLYCLFM